MVDGSQRVTFDDVEVVRSTDLMLMCRVGERLIGVPPRRMLSGSTIYLTGGQGQLVLS